MIFRDDILKDRVALITGGGTGIGRAIALEYAKVGADIAVAGRTRETLESTVADVQALGRRALAVPTDIRVPDQVDALVQRIIQEFGKIDILVNSAGGLFRARPEDMSPNAWTSIVDLNLNAQFFCCRAVGKVMIQQRRGKIVNISSTSAFKGSPGSPHNAAAKAGMHAMARSLAHAWAQYNIQVNDIAPGLIATDVIKERVWPTPEALKQVAETVPMKRLGEPEEVAYAAVFLASDAANYITGEVLTIDGGEWLTSARSS